MNKNTPLTEIKALPGGAKDKLAQLNVLTLGDVAARLSRAELKRARRIGPKTIQCLERLLKDAGLTLREEPGPRPEIASQAQSYHNEIERIKNEVAAWVAAREPDVLAARRDARPGAYGDYVKAQIRALDHVQGAPTFKRELEHQLVRTLNRYQREQKYAKSKHALRDGMYARG